MPIMTIIHFQSHKQCVKLDSVSSYTHIASRPRFIFYEMLNIAISPPPGIFSHFYLFHGVTQLEAILLLQ